MRIHSKHSGGSTGQIDLYLQEPYHGAPDATLTVQTRGGLTAEEVNAIFEGAINYLPKMKEPKDVISEQKLNTIKDLCLACGGGTWCGRGDDPKIIFDAHTLDS